MELDRSKQTKYGELARERIINKHFELDMLMNSTLTGWSDLRIFSSAKTQVLISAYGSKCKDPFFFVLRKNCDLMLNSHAERNL